MTTSLWNPYSKVPVMLGETLSFPTPEQAYERLRLAQSWLTTV